MDGYSKSSINDPSKQKKKQDKEKARNSIGRLQVRNGIEAVVIECDIGTTVLVGKGDIRA